MKHRAFNGTLQDHIKQGPFGEMRWDVIQATYSLQSFCQASGLRCCNGWANTPNDC